MNAKPLKKKVLVAQNKTEVKSPSGIILEDAASVRESKTATVVAIGPDVKDVAVGDKVLLDWTKGFVVKVDGVERVIIDEEHIVAVMES